MSSAAAVTASARPARAMPGANPAAAAGSLRRQQVLTIVQGALLVVGVFAISIILALQAAANLS